MLCSNTDIQDNDWDSVRQANAALVRDLERLYLSLGGGGNDLGGASPKSANDQTVAQDGNYGFQAVTTDMLDEAEQRFNAALDAIPSVTYPISIADGGTGATTAGGALSSLGTIFDNSTRTAFTSGTSTFTVPAGVYSIFVDLIGAGGGGGYTNYTPVTFYVDEGGVLNARAISTSAQAQQGGCGGRIYIFLRVTPGEQFDITVGAGGSAGTAGATTGGTGGNTTFSKTSGSILLAQATGGGGGVGFITRSTNNAGGFGMYSYTNMDRDFWAISIKGQSGFPALATAWPDVVGVDLSQPQVLGHCPLGLTGSFLYGGGGDGRRVYASGAATSSVAGESGYATIFY